MLSVLYPELVKIPQTMEKLLPRGYVYSGRTAFRVVQALTGFCKIFTQDTIALGLRLGASKNIGDFESTTYSLFPFPFFQAAFITDYILVRTLRNLCN
jgi:hypothetical protein